jgi:hypothetical protein
MNRLLADIALLIALVLLALITDGEHQIAAVVGIVLAVIAIAWTYSPVRAA